MNERPTALRKSVDQYSAGTRVDVVREEYGAVIVQPLCHPEVEIAVETRDLVSLRARAKLVEIG